MTSLDRYYFLRGPILKYSHTGGTTKIHSITPILQVKKLGTERLSEQPKVTQVAVAIFRPM